MEEQRLFRKDILRILENLDFLKDCWLTSGAALVLYGVKESTRDIDLICATELADRLEERGYPFRRCQDNTRIFSVGSQVEVLENWHTEQVVELDSLRIASLQSIRRQKEELGREKDFADIRLIDEFLERST